MSLSEAQMLAVNHGTTTEIAWSPPHVTPHLSVPSWVKDVDIQWMEGYSNPPNIRLLVEDGVHSWPDERWINQAGYWRCYSTDGRMKQHFHAGSLTWNEERRVWQTPQDQGYSGRTFEIEAWPDHVPDPARGTKVELRGPWHTGVPDFWQEVTTIEEHFSTTFNRDWRESGGCFGLALHQPMLYAILQRFAPELKVAAVSRYDGPLRLEPYKPEWPGPKGTFHYHCLNCNIKLRYPHCYTCKKDSSAIVAGIF